MTILNETLNFYRLYQHCMGTSEVPQVYHYWSCLSLVASVLEDRVYFELYRDEPVYPNLYVMLLGPSGVCKGLAIGAAKRLLDKADNVEINTYRGQLTAPGLVDVLGGRAERDKELNYINDAKLWLLMDELANDIGAGGPTMVRSFLKMMTELFTGHYVFNTGTRMHGYVTIDNACVNWLCGTQKAWLLDVLTRDMVHSGFTPRLFPVFSGYVNEAVKWPDYPPDRDQVYEHLKARLLMLRCISGGFKITPQADAVYSKWYEERVPPDDDMLRPFWQRQREFMFKLAMILSVMDAGPLVINSNHVCRALGLISQATRWHQQLIEVASVTRETVDINEVTELLMKKKVITRSALLKGVHRRGYNAYRLEKVMKDLLQSEQVTQSVGAKGAVVYNWVG